MISLSPESGGWIPPVVSTVATTGEGFPELATKIVEHFTFLETSGLLQQRREQRVRDYLLARAFAQIRSSLIAQEQSANLAAQVTTGQISASAAVNQLTNSV